MTDHGRIFMRRSIHISFTGTLGERSLPFSRKVPSGCFEKAGKFRSGEIWCDACP
jgi:hypothetical protein